MSSASDDSTLVRTGSEAVSSSPSISMVLVFGVVGAGVGEMGRLDKSLGGPKPSRSSVACITSVEYCSVSSGMGEEYDIRPFPGGGVSRAGVSIEKDSRVSSSSSSKPSDSELVARRLVKIFESVPLDDLVTLAPCLRDDVLVVGML